MTVIPLPSATRVGANSEPYTRVSGRAEPRDFATSAAGLVHRATSPLLRALEDAVATAAAQGLNDTGARQAADRLRDACIALDIAVIAAGRTLADREHHVHQAPNHALLNERSRSQTRSGYPFSAMSASTAARVRTGTPVPPFVV
jgi:hypothetical protein